MKIEHAFACHSFAWLVDKAESVYVDAVMVEYQIQYKHGAITLTMGRLLCIDLNVCRFI